MNPAPFKLTALHGDTLVFLLVLFFLAVVICSVILGSAARVRETERLWRIAPKPGETEE
jgi:hypothetical protein